MRIKKLIVKMSCLGLTICTLSQTGFVSMAAENTTALSFSNGFSLNSGISSIEAGAEAGTEVKSIFTNGFSFSSGISALAKEEKSDVSLYENLAIAKISDYVNIRSEASAESEMLGKIYDQCAATILDTVEKEDGTWYHIKSGSVTGYIKAEYFVTGFEAEKFAKENAHMYTRATAGGLRVRESAALDAEVVASLYEGETCTVLEDNGEFVKVRTKNDKEGYVYGEYVEIFIKCDEAISKAEEEAMIAEQKRLEEEARKKAEEEARRKAEEERKKREEEEKKNNANKPQQQRPQNNTTSTTPVETPTVNVGDASAARQTIVNFALSKVGMEYVWGGDGAHEGGYDCSGLVKAAYAQVGISLPRTSGEQGKRGARVSVSEAQPGDILWKNGHVGIYLGNDKYVHASTYGVGVIVSNGASGAFTCARRVVD